MKIGKKTGMIASFIVGATIFASTAVADIVSQSGYDQLKNAAKYTAESCAGKLNNFTVEFSGVIKSDGKVIDSGENINKYDNINKIAETTEKDENSDHKSGYYKYEDKKCSIDKNDSGNVYSETEYSGDGNRNYMFEDPFKQEDEKEAEKILDALVGNIKDSAIVTEGQDGEKDISGSLTETQIPAIANALISYEYKNEISQRHDYDSMEKSNAAKLTDDIYLKEGKLQVSINKEGLINNLFITGTISGKDKDGNVHNVIAELLFKLYDINSTIVNKPNLEGKKVEKSTRSENSQEQVITKKCIGKYTNDIILEKDDKFTKIGERILEITNVDETDSDKITVKCKYHEEYKKEYADTYKAMKDMNFDISVNKYDSFGTFVYTDEWGNKKHGTISASSDTPGLTMALNMEKDSDDNIKTDGIFSRSFDK